MKDKKIQIFKLIILIVFVAIMIFLTIQLVPIFKSISTTEGRMNFEREIESLGGKGIFTIIRANDCANISAYSSTVNR